MNLFLFVRNSLGIGQEALAQLLDVHHSTLKMAEKGHRTLPPAAMQRLMWMVHFLESQSGEGMEETFAPEKVEEVLRKIRSKKRKADKEVAALHTQHGQMQQRLEFETAFLSQYPSEDHPSEASRISAMSFDARSFLTHRDQEARLEMLIRQVGLTAIESWLEKKF